MHARIIRERAARFDPAVASREAVRRDFRAGDVRHSLADVSKARTLLGYEPTHSVAAGLDRAAEWYASSPRTR